MWWGEGWSGGVRWWFGGVRGGVVGRGVVWWGVRWWFGGVRWWFGGVRGGLVGCEVVWWVMCCFPSVRGRKRFVSQGDGGAVKQPED